MEGELSLHPFVPCRTQKLFNGVGLVQIMAMYFFPNPGHPLGTAWTLSPEPYHEHDVLGSDARYLGYSIEDACLEVPLVPFEEKENRAYILAKVSSLVGLFSHVFRLRRVADNSFSLAFLLQYHNYFVSEETCVHLPPSTPSCRPHLCPLLPLTSPSCPSPCSQLLVRRILRQDRPNDCRHLRRRLDRPREPSPGYACRGSHQPRQAQQGGVRSRGREEQGHDRDGQPRHLADVSTTLPPPISTLTSELGLTRSWRSLRIRRPYEGTRVASLFFPSFLFSKLTSSVSPLTLPRSTALCLGVPFINPVRDWNRDDPDNRDTWYSQHNGLHELSPPYVYHIVRPNPPSDSSLHSLFMLTLVPSSLLSPFPPPFQPPSCHPFCFSPTRLRSCSTITTNLLSPVPSRPPSPRPSRAATSSPGCDKRR